MFCSTRPPLFVTNISFACSQTSLLLAHKHLFCLQCIDLVTPLVWERSVDDNQNLHFVMDVAPREADENHAEAWESLKDTARPIEWDVGRYMLVPESYLVVTLKNVDETWVQGIADNDDFKAMEEAENAKESGEESSSDDGGGGESGTGSK